MTEVKTLRNTSLTDIYNAFIEAFFDYDEPVNLTYDGFKFMVERRGLNLDFSFGAFENNKLVGFTLNGIGKWNGNLTAYDTGTGVIKEFRNQGVALNLFTKSVPFLLENNINYYLLEVLKTNTKAFDLYKKAGFNVTREFDYYYQPVKEINIESFNQTIQIIETNKPQWQLYQSFWDFKPSWQNSIDSIERKFEHFTFIEALLNNQTVGYAIIDKFTGDIPQFAVNSQFRNMGVASTLFYKLAKITNSVDLRIINTETGNNGIKELMKKLGIKAGSGQYEMLAYLL